MIAYLRGALLQKTTQSAIIEAGGIGYEVLVPLSTFYTLPEEGNQVSLHIYTHVREDALTLFGFHTKSEKNLFIMLISVSGIGPKLAVNILSGMGPQDLMEAIARNDAPRLQAIPGVGKKTAERIALELKDKAGRALGDGAVEEIAPPPPGEREAIDDALSALVNLGYPPKSAKQAVEKVRRGGGAVSLEDLIREALKALV